MPSVNHKYYIRLAVVVLVCGVSITASFCVLQRPENRRPQAEVRRSPNGTVEARLLFKTDGTPEFGIVSLLNQQVTKVSKLEPGEGVADNFTWSPGGKLLTFETYNLQGHSPMTTNHVWVVKADGSGLQEILLPPPNQRFSTRIDRWISDDTLRIRTTLLQPERDVFYAFNYSTQVIQIDQPK